MYNVIGIYVVTTKNCIENNFETIMNSPFIDGFNLTIRKNSFNKKFSLHNNGCITLLNNSTCKMNLIKNNQKIIIGFKQSPSNWFPM